MCKIKNSVIIPTYNKGARLVLMLYSIRCLTHIENCEFIFVNDGSTDQTADILQQFQEENKEKVRIKLMTTVNSGRSAARNAGIEEAEGELLIFTDDDMILPPNFVLYHERLHDSAEDLAVHGRIFSLPYLKFFSDPMNGVLYDGTNVQGILKSKLLTPEMFENGGLEVYLMQNAKISKFEADIQELYTCTDIEESRVRWVGFTGGNISVRRKNLKKIRGFDPQMGKIWGCEDLETGYRLYQSGIRFVYNRKAANYHMNHYRMDSKEAHQKSMEYFIRKHRDTDITHLQEYFDKKMNSLVEWRNMMQK